MAGHFLHKELMLKRYKTNSLAAGVIVVALIFIIYSAIILGSTYLIWLLWCWVMPQLFPLASLAIVTPPFWTFFGAWVLVGFIRNKIFGSKHEESTK